MTASPNVRPMFNTVAIVGVGLIGGSLGMAAKERKLARRVTGIGRSEQKLMRAKILGAIDDYCLDLETGASDADLVVICTPVRTVVPTIERMAASFKPGAIVTDVGSTKAEIVSGASRVVPAGKFVGGHPMAGSEQAGVDAAFPDLFLGATYVLTPTDETDLDALGAVAALAEAVGARVETMSPEEHDAAVAVISHLPHVISCALLHTAEDLQRRDGRVFRLAAGSFRDLTRISDSPPVIWRDICLSNRSAIAAGIELFQEWLSRFRRALEADDADAVMSAFEEACRIRETYLRMLR